MSNKMDYDKLRELSNDITELLISKNKDYGDSFTDTMDTYGVGVGLARISDKFSRLNKLYETYETNYLNEVIKKGEIVDKESIINQEGLVSESFDDTLRDLIGYLTLMLEYLNRDNKGGK